MGLKGYRLWIMGQLDSNVQRPTVQELERHPALLQVGQERPHGHAG
jgi:hypothetical protein